jgi:hypothetical protein
MIDDKTFTFEPIDFGLVLFMISTIWFVVTQMS